MKTALRFLLLLLVGCASATTIPDEDRSKLSDTLTGRSRFLRVSLYKGPFWSDDGKVLLSDVDPTGLEYLTDTRGEVIRTGAATGVVPLGRRARITKVEFPTAMVVAGRMVYTPRYNPWVYLEVEGEDAAKPMVLVLRSQIKNADEFQTILGRYLSEEDPAPALVNYSEDVRKAVVEKRVVNEMDPNAVQMAWGYPEKKRIDLKEGHRSEVWSYGGGKRTVTFVDGKVVKSTEGVAPSGS